MVGMSGKRNVSGDVQEPSESVDFPCVTNPLAHRRGRDFERAAIG